MQIDIVTLCLFAILIIVAFMFMSRMMGQGRGYPGNRGGAGVPPRGPNRPQVDDPDIQSRGGFGDQQSARGSGSSMSSGSRSESGGSASATGTPGRQGGPLFPTQAAPSRRDNDDDDDRSPARRAGGLFGDRNSSNDNDDDRPSRKRDNDGPADDPDIESRGGFGRPK